MNRLNLRHEGCIQGDAEPDDGHCRLREVAAAEGHDRDDRGKEWSTMLRRMILVAAAASWSFSEAGCGDSAGIYPVSGKVLCKGEPAAGAVVYFHPEGDASVARDVIPHATVEDDGSFLLSSGDLGSGARPGKYAVLVQWRDPAGDGIVPASERSKSKLTKRSRMRLGPDRLKGRYFDISQPLLHVLVKPESNQLPPFELVN